MFLFVFVSVDTTFVFAIDKNHCTTQTNSFLTISKPQSGDAQATCDVGGIGSPVCGACSFALSLFLSVALFFLLL